MIFSEFFTFRNGKLITADIFLIGRMTFDPVQLHLMPAHFSEKGFPEVWVKGGFFIAFDPVVFAPGVYPALFQRIDQILGIAV